MQSSPGVYGGIVTPQHRTVLGGARPYPVRGLTQVGTAARGGGDGVPIQARSSNSRVSAHPVMHAAHSVDLELTPRPFLGTVGDQVLFHEAHVIPLTNHLVDVAVLPYVRTVTVATREGENTGGGEQQH